VIRVNPSPFSGSTRFDFTLRSRSETSVRIYDIQGRLVRTLVSKARTEGLQSAIWDGRNDADQLLSSGTYFYELRLDGKVKNSGRAVLLR
jgi:flagellar hook assembly protein FlgD